MSLEQAIQENTAALREVIVLLKNPAAVPANPTQPAAPKAAAPKPAKPAAPKAPAAPEIEEITAKQVSDATLKLAADKGRDTAVKVLAKYKAATGKPAARGSEIQPGDYAAFIADVAAQYA